MSGNSILKVTLQGLSFMSPLNKKLNIMCAKDGRSINENYGTDLDKLEEGDKVLGIAYK